MPLVRDNDLLTWQEWVKDRDVVEHVRLGRKRVLAELSEVNGFKSPTELLKARHPEYQECRLLLESRPRSYHTEPEPDLA